MASSVGGLGTLPRRNAYLKMVPEIPRHSLAPKVFNHERILAGCEIQCPLAVAR